MAYDQLASDSVIENTIASLTKHNFTGEVVADKAEALARIRELIPAGASLLQGTSVTLEEIGFMDLLKSGAHPWKNNKDAVLAESDPARQSLLRKQGTISDYYLGSVHALTESGEFIIASNTGSQLPSVVFNSQHLILVVGSQKIVPDVMDGMKRIREYVVPLEEVHMQSLGWGHTLLSKMLIYNEEKPTSGRTIHLIIVKEKLGF